MFVVPFVWVVASPFATAAVIAHLPRANALAARRLAWTLALGWLGVALLIGGAFVGPDTAGTIMIALGAPLAGLSFWMRAPDRDDGDEPGDDPQPPPDEWDWDQFLTDLEDWRLRRESQRSTRGPSGSSSAARRRDRRRA